MSKPQLVAILSELLRVDPVTLNAHTYEELRDMYTQTVDSLVLA